MAVIVPPPHAPERAFGVETTKPAGSVSVNETLLIGNTVLGLVIVNDKVVEPFNWIVGDPNALVKVGAAMTLTVAVPVFPFPPLVEPTTLVVLVLAPSEVPFTSILTVQIVFAPIVPPVKLMTEVFCVAVRSPPQEFVKPFGVLITKPDGKVSEKDNPLKVAAFPLVIV